MEHITHVICSTGTTAFPSQRWEFSSDYSWWRSLQRYVSPAQCRQQARNSPKQADARGIANVVAATPKTVQRFVMVSSCGVLRKEQFPFNILNGFGVLDAKLAGEQALIQSGLPYTIIRAGRLIDGPFTSYDLNTLLQAKTNQKFGVVLGQGDRLTGQTSRIDLAAACVASITAPEVVNHAFECISKGDRPQSIDWPQLFQTLS